MITEQQKTILDGCLLGDGSLMISKHGKNPYFLYTSKNKDHVEYVFKYFKSLCNYDKVKKTSYFDKRTSKRYTRYYFITKCLEEFMPTYRKWYVENDKNKIPEDFTLNKTNCLLWYLGDGGICKSKRTEYIKLATNCFDPKSLSENTIPQLIDFEAKIYFTDNQPIIIIPRRNCKKFLDFIGKCPVKSYTYKWNLTEYKNKKFMKKIDPLSNDDIDKICELYTSGTSYANISKTLNLDHNRVKYYLVKKGIYQPGRDKLQKRLSTEEIFQIADLRKSGVKWKNIEEKYNLSRFVLSHYIKSLDK